MDKRVNVGRFAAALIKRSPSQPRTVARLAFFGVFFAPVSHRILVLTREEKLTLERLTNGPQQVCSFL